ncbi:MAG: DUF2851 family protein [Muribaculaceae bacterium]|nr:DUF2851 family protein [Muribaculaceae bacterium]
MWGREMATLQGQRVRICNPGRHNKDAGPDFANARLVIDGREWVGDVEIHVKASDWYRHGHDKDPAYNSVILHIVVVDDRRICRASGEEIPQVTVLMPEKFYVTYAELTKDLKSIRCGYLLGTLPSLIREDWLESLGVERVQMKAQRLLDYNARLNGDWEQAVFVMMARGLGFGLNGLPFEMLAMNLPLKYVYHHAQDLMQVEALLFGQAGMLNACDHLFDDYYQRLCVEYGFLARKYGLRPMNPSVWKYARTRPQNFPHRRIAMLARALHEGVRFSSSLKEAKGDFDKLMEFFSIKIDGYWGSHFAFGSDAGESLPRSLSYASRILLLINVASPFYTAYASLDGDYVSAEASARLLAGLPAEKNSKLKVWEELGFKADDALRSQSLLHLRDEYCDKGRCLECRFGHFFLRRESKPQLCERTAENINSMRLCMEPV